MTKQVLTTQERQESFFTTLGRLKTAIKQADYSPAHKQRALSLYERVSEQINDVSAELLDVHIRLTTSEVTGVDVRGEEEDEEEYYPVSSAELDTWAEFDAQELDGLNGEEEHLAKLTLLQGEGAPEIL